MKQIFTGIFVILTISVLSVAAQTTATRQAFEKGIISAKSEKFETALEDFRKSLTLAETVRTSDNFRARIHFNLGVCLYRLRQNADAVNEFERAIKLAKDDYEKAFYALGMAHAELGNWRKAEEAFRGAIRLNERNGEAWFDLAFVFLAQNDYDSAQTAFEKSIALGSIDAFVSHNNLGVIFAINGDLTAAVREFEIALKKSNGKFAAAARNLQFCKTFGENISRDLIAKLEFGK